MHSTLLFMHVDCTSLFKIRDLLVLLWTRLATAICITRQFSFCSVVLSNGFGTSYDIVIVRSSSQGCCIGRGNNAVL